MAVWWEVLLRDRLPRAVQTGQNKKKALIIFFQDALCSPAAAAAPAQAVPLVLCPTLGVQWFVCARPYPSRETGNMDPLLGWWSWAVGAHPSREKLNQGALLNQPFPFALQRVGVVCRAGCCVWAGVEVVAVGDADSNILGWFPHLIPGDRLVIDQNACLPLV